MNELQITIKNFIPETFSLIFQQGVILKVRTGVTLKDFLCLSLGLSSDYIENRIATIFIDDKPVDNLDTSHIKDKSTISLSAAMPGLVGATMRRGGFYASFRNTITYSDEGAGSQTNGIVRIKLFNVIIKEIGANLLERGIYISNDDIKLIINDKGNDFLNNCAYILFNGKEIKPEKFIKTKRKYDSILLKLQIEF
jgi:hypothetical protein